MSLRASESKYSGRLVPVELSDREQASRNFGKVDRLSGEAYVSDYSQERWQVQALSLEAARLTEAAGMPVKKLMSCRQTHSTHSWST